MGTKHPDREYVVALKLVGVALFAPSCILAFYGLVLGPLQIQTHWELVAGAIVAGSMTFFILRKAATVFWSALVAAVIGIFTFGAALISLIEMFGE